MFRYFADKIAVTFFSKGHNSGKGHNPVNKKICVSDFFIRNPYKKFQNSSMHGSKVMLCIKKRDERTDERPRSNMPLQLLRSLWHKNSSESIFIPLKITEDDKLYFLHFTENKLWHLRKTNDEFLDLEIISILCEKKRPSADLTFKLLKINTRMVCIHI